jgi:hypothetical protein
MQCNKTCAAALDAQAIFRRRRHHASSAPRGHQAGQTSAKDGAEDRPGINRAGPIRSGGHSALNAGSLNTPPFFGPGPVNVT